MKTRTAFTGRKFKRRAKRLAALAAVAALLAAGWAANNGVFSGVFSQRHGRSFTVQGGEHRPVLDPFRFRGHGAVAAYAAAQRYPDVMDQVYCYCQCDRPPFLHKSLLSCFAEDHGAS